MSSGMDWEFSMKTVLDSLELLARKLRRMGAQQAEELILPHFIISSLQTSSYISLPFRFSAGASAADASFGGIVMPVGERLVLFAHFRGDSIDSFSELVVSRRWHRVRSFVVYVVHQ